MVLMIWRSIPLFTLVAETYIKILLKYGNLEYELSVTLLFSSGACEGTLACSTCHLIFEDHIFEKLDAITDEEMDMLDLAYGLTDT